MSRSVRDPDYRRPVTVLFHCYECSTLTTNLPDASGVALCDKHLEGTHEAA